MWRPWACCRNDFWPRLAVLASSFRQWYPLVTQHNYRKSLFLVEKNTINGHFPQLFWHNQRVKPALGQRLEGELVKNCLASELPIFGNSWSDKRHAMAGWGFFEKISSHGFKQQGVLLSSPVNRWWSKTSIISGWWFQPLWKIWVNWENYSQYMKKNMFQPPNQILMDTTVLFQWKP